MQALMPPVNTPDQLFHDGDPTQGVEGTIVTAEWMNDSQGATRDTQQELINVLAAAAMQPDASKQNQLITAINKILGDATSGGIKSVNGKTADENGAVEVGINDISDAGTAAKGTVVTSTTDTTSGRIPVVGWMGVGGSVLSATDANLTDKAGLVSMLFKQGGGSGSAHFNAFGAGGFLGAEHVEPGGVRGLFR